MSIEYTHICDGCGIRHTGELAPLNWKKNVHIVVDAEDLPNYSPFYVSERRELLCDNCIASVSGAVKAALVPRRASP